MAIIVPASPVKRYHLSLIIVSVSQIVLTLGSLLLQYLLASFNTLYVEGEHSGGMPVPVNTAMF